MAEGNYGGGGWYNLEPAFENYELIRDPEKKIEVLDEAVGVIVERLDAVSEKIDYVYRLIAYILQEPEGPSPIDEYLT